MLPAEEELICRQGRTWDRAEFSHGTSSPRDREMFAGEDAFDDLAAVVADIANGDVMLAHAALYHV